MTILLAYRASDGAVSLKQHASNSLQFIEFWRTHWDVGGTQVMPFSHKDRQHVLLYNAEDGNYAIHRLKRNGRDFKEQGRAHWSPHRTTLLPYHHNGRFCIVSYRLIDGWATIEQLESEGCLFREIWREQWSTGWSAMTSTVYQEKPYLFAYKEGNGALAMDRLTDQEAIEIWDGDWRAGWTHISHLLYEHVPYFITYDQNTGQARLDRIRDNGRGVDAVWQGRLVPGFSQLVTDHQHNHLYLLGYISQTGEVETYQVKLDQNIDLHHTHRDEWQSGWDHIICLVP